MSKPQKIGENFAKGSLAHGLVELRNLASFQESNITEDIRWSMKYGQQQGQGQQQSQQQEQQQER